MILSIPKTASTNVKTYLVGVSNRSDLTEVQNRSRLELTMVHDRHSENTHMRRLSFYPAPMAKVMLARWRKFTIVRNPLDRLISAWHDKIGTANSDVWNLQAYQVRCLFRFLY